MENKFKGLREFVINVDIPEGKQLSGVIPFQATINQNKGRFKVYATSLDEAKQIVDSYLNN